MLKGFSLDDTLPNTPPTQGASEVKGFELKGMKVEEMLNITMPTD